MYIYIYICIIYIYAYRVLLPLLLLLCDAILLLLLQQQQCCCFLLLLVIVYGVAKVGAGSSNLILVLHFFAFKRDLFFIQYTPWHYCVAFTVLICLHPWSLWACAEPRRAPARRPPCKCMYRYVANVSAIEKPHLDQVFSRKRPSSRSTIRCAACSSCLTCSPLLTLLGVASAVLASSPWERCCFRFLVKITVPISFVYSYV